MAYPGDARFDRALRLTSASPRYVAPDMMKKITPLAQRLAVIPITGFPVWPSDTATRYAATQETMPITEDKPIKTRIQVSRLVLISRGMYSGRGLPLPRAISPVPAA